MIRDNKKPGALTPGWLKLIMASVIFASLSNFAIGADKVTLAGLNKLSQQLVNQLRSGKAEATAFRTNAVYYRESLRNLLLEDEKVKPHRIHKDLQLHMVRMAALLQSAADCKTGRYIVCPQNLMHNLKKQQFQLNQMLARPNASR